MTIDPRFTVQGEQMLKLGDIAIEAAKVMLRHPTKQTVDAYNNAADDAECYDRLPIGWQVLEV